MCISFLYFKRLNSNFKRLTAHLFEFEFNKFEYYMFIAHVLFVYFFEILKFEYYPAQVLNLKRL